MFYFYKYKINVSSSKPFPCLHTLLSLTQPINHPTVPVMAIYTLSHQSSAKGTWVPVQSLTFPVPDRDRVPVTAPHTSTEQHRPQRHLCRLLTMPVFLHSATTRVCNFQGHFTFSTCHVPPSFSLLDQELNSPTLSCWYYQSINNKYQSPQKTKTPTLPTSASVGAPRTFLHTADGSMCDAMPTTAPWEAALPPPASLGCPCHGWWHRQRTCRQAPSPHIHCEHRMKNATSQAWISPDYANKNMKAEKLWNKAKRTNRNSHTAEQIQAHLYLQCICLFNITCSIQNQPLSLLWPGSQLQT